MHLLLDVIPSFSLKLETGSLTIRLKTMETQHEFGNQSLAATIIFEMKYSTSNGETP